MERTSTYATNNIYTLFGSDTTFAYSVEKDDSQGNVYVSGL
jgi:hypothetical protein